MTPPVAPGRPRSEEADAAILSAALDAIIEHGASFTVEGVAAGACVGKATVYRRYPTKEALLNAVLDRSMREKVPIPELGDLEAELRALLHGLVTMTTTPLGQLLRCLVGNSSAFSDITEFREHFARRRREGGLAVIDRAIARGELPAGTDPELALDLVVGPVFYRFLISNGALDDEFIEGQLAEVMRALRPVKV